MIRLLDLAPHATLPPVDGADKRAWHLYCEMMASADLRGSFVARTVVVHDQGVTVPHSAPRSWRDRKGIAALAAVATGSDYWKLKMLRPGVKRAVVQAVGMTCDTILVNFLYALPLLRIVPKPYRLLVDTHNYDPACFHALANGALNPFLRLLCRRAADRSEHVLRELPTGTVLVHVSNRDAVRYRRHRPDLEHVVIENGTVVRPRKEAPDYGTVGKRILLFVGSLSAKTNQDALEYFSACFWPVLRQTADFRVAGSDPPTRVRALCSRQGWVLHENVSEDRLDQLYTEAHFVVLPFAYGEGSKLKLIEACGRGVPVFATRAGVVGAPRTPSLVTVSDEAAAWRALMTETRGISKPAVNEALAFAEEFSWSRLAKRLIEIARRSPLVS
jgi:glycosyltransferase involved in cell wall biosynthesis